MCLPEVVSCRSRHFGGLKIDLDQADATFATKSLGLSPAETAILFVLAGSSAQPLDRLAITNRLEQLGRPLPPPMIDVCVLRLRRKLAAAGWGGRLHTVPGRGYGLAAPDRDSDAPPVHRRLPTDRALAPAC